MKRTKVRNSKYWQQRAIELEEASHKTGIDTYNQIEEAFTQAQRELQAEIDKWYRRIAINNEISMADAMKLLDDDELDEFHWTVWQYIEKGRENQVNQKWIKELENASAKVHIRKLEALKTESQNSLETAYAIYHTLTDDMVRKVYKDGIYNTASMLSEGFGIRKKVPTINHRVLDKVASKPWAADGKNFSDRIWENKEAMVNNLHKELTRTAIRGGKPDEAIASMVKYVKKDVKNKEAAAARLVQTEQAYFHTKAALDSFSSMDVEKIEFVSTLDTHTCDVCGDMDGYVFPIKQADPGVNVPPLHPRCRCVIVPYYDDDDDGMRAARDPESGKTYYVPENTTYKQWKGKYVREPEHSIIRSYKEAKGILGSNTPDIEEYRKIQYNKNRKSSFDAYKRMIHTGELTPLATFDLFEKTENQLQNGLKDVVTSNGIKITGCSKHCVARVLGSVEERRSGVGVEDVIETLKSNTSKVGAIKTRKDGKKSQRFISRSAMVTVNPDTGMVIQVNPHGRRK